MMKEFFAAPIAPQEITYPAERLEYTRRGANPHGSFKNNLAISFDWTAKVVKQEVPVYFTPMSHGGPHSFCQIIKNEEHKPLTITLHFAHKLRSVKVRSRQIQIQWNTQEENIVCTVDACGTFTVEVNDGIYTPITVFVRSPIEPPQDNDSSVLRFGPGYHQVDYIELQSCKKVFVDAEAIVHAVAPDITERPEIEKDWADRPNYKDFITATESANIEISGYGILDLSELEWHARRTICFSDCTGIVINGPILLGAAHWTVALFNCKNVVLKNLVLFGYRENSDGIDIVNCENVQVDNCFIRTGDDGICIKSIQSFPIYGGKNIIVENCTIWNDKVRALSIAGESKSNISNVVFRNCEVLHSLADWAHEVGSLCIVLCDSGTVHDIIYENIFIYQESAQAINCMLFKDQWSTDIEVGHINNVIFRNIAVPENACIRMWGYDEAHCVENIKLQNIIGTKSTLLLDCNAYTKNIVF